MLRYIPEFIWERFQAGETSGRFQGFTLLADIAGFTETVTRLQALGNQGAEEMGGLLNAVFAEAITTVRGWGGFVSVFAGDAFCSIFPSDKGLEVWHATRCLADRFAREGEAKPS